METNEMTVHRALAELKLIDNKIEKHIESIMPTSYKQGDGLIAGIFKQEDFDKAAQGHYDSVIALLERKVKIKAAIVKSNSNTQIKVGETTMSVADAIANKSMIALKKNFISQLKAKHKNAVASVNKNNEVINNNLQKLLEMTLGKDNVKAENTDVDAIMTPYLKNNKVILIDPLGVDKKVEQLEKEIAEFEMNVDVVLSESNAVTKITIV